MHMLSLQALNLGLPCFAQEWEDLEDLNSEERSGDPGASFRHLVAGVTYFRGLNQG